MGTSDDRAVRRRAKLQALQAQQRRSERIRTVAIIGTACLVAVAIVSGAVFVVLSEQDRDRTEEAAAQGPIDGVEEFGQLSRDHVETAVDYPQTPPAGGEHNPTWINCGAYTEPVDPAQAVHSLEHGAVWITYRPGLPEAQLDRLTELAGDNDYVLLSPYEELRTPIAASAWGKQLAVDSADDPRLMRFVTKYQQGPQTPEPGAPCSGGAGGMG